MSEERSKRQKRLDFGSDDGIPDDGFNLDGLIFRDSMRKDYGHRKKTETPIEAIIPFYRLDYTTKK